MFKPRPKQREVLNYTGGKMGVSAVPGSGKTRTLSYLAAQIIATQPLEAGQEVLVVTLVNSAVGNFARQVGEFIKDRGLLPGWGYRVRTLHGLANDIVRERPSLVGLSEDFNIIDERDADEVLQDAVDAWVRNHVEAPDEYLSPDKFNDQWIRNTKWPELVKTMAGNFIKAAKDSKLSPQQVRELLHTHREHLPLAEMCTDIYEAYERGLHYRGAVDFQDLIRLALRVLEIDEEYLARLQHRWPYILEDEAQDSSKLQEDIIRMLIGKRGNWVRVGDPNQAIYETFTTADPKYLRAFLTEKGVKARELPNSGRSTQSVIDLANGLIEWSLKHPNEAIREKKPLDAPYIEPTPTGDPQGNPPDLPDGIYFHTRRLTPDQERDLVLQSVKKWLSTEPDSTAAILLPINSSGANMVDVLRREGLPYVENLRTTTSTRAVVGSFTYILQFLESPTDSRKLARAYRVWQRDLRDDPESADLLNTTAKLLESAHDVENFVAPRLEDWLADTVSQDEHTFLYNHLQEFRQVIKRWQDASSLPIDQLILTISADLLKKESEIATAYSLALYLRRFSNSHPEARLPEFVTELDAIARNQRDFSGAIDEEDQFDPDKHKGKIAVTTMHKAKGLEWDRVYLMSVNNYSFPSAEPYDDFMGERWFIRDNLNLEAEALGQLRSLTSGTNYVEGTATAQARVEYAAERLRLFYVGITRARRELIITWNTGKSSQKESVEAVPLAALRAYWKAKHPQENPQEEQS